MIYCGAKSGGNPLNRVFLHSISIYVFDLFALELPIYIYMITVISPPKHSAAICDGSKGFTSASLKRNQRSCCMADLLRSLMKL